MQKMQLNKGVGFLLSLALLCSLAACGTPATQQTASSSQSQAAQSSSQSSSSETPQSSATASSTESSSSQASQAPQSSEANSSSESSSSQSSQAPQSSSAASKPEAATSTAPKSEGKVMVVYFSATGNTKAVAKVIATSTDGELYEIIPEVPYTADDLNWNESTSRTNKEHEDPSIRPAIAGGTANLSGYDTIFIGYPLWWGEAPNIVWNFVESNDLSDKTVIPFATSLSSGFGASGETLKGMAPDANWLDGQRFRSGAAEADVQSWVSGLNIQ